MQNIFLIGFMGAGKSTIAKWLHRKQGMYLVEMDEEIARREHMSIPEIFDRKGEEYFRKLETDLLESLGEQENTVVSCGGGVAMRQCNVDAMKKNGVVVYLSAAPETVYDRVKGSHNRPLLEGNMNVAYIAKLMENRLPRYMSAADLTVRTDGRKTEDICREILREVQ